MTTAIATIRSPRTFRSVNGRTDTEIRHRPGHVVLEQRIDTGGEDTGKVQLVVDDAEEARRLLENMTAAIDAAFPKGDA